MAVLRTCENERDTDSREREEEEGKEKKKKATKVNPELDMFLLGDFI